MIWLIGFVVVLLVLGRLFGAKAVLAGCGVAAVAVVGLIVFGGYEVVHNVFGGEQDVATRSSTPEPADRYTPGPALHVATSPPTESSMHVTQQGSSVEFGETPPSRRVFENHATIVGSSSQSWTYFYKTKSAWCNALDVMAEDVASGHSEPRDLLGRVEGLDTISAGIHVKYLGRESLYCHSGISQESQWKDYDKVHVTDTASNLNNQTGLVDAGQVRP